MEVGKLAKCQEGGGQETAGIINIYGDLLHARKEFLKSLLHFGRGQSFVK